MIQPRNRAGFPVKSLARFFVTGKFRTQNLNGHHPINPRIINLCDVQKISLTLLLRFCPGW
jgi:hypothetical protein